jgi:predicted glutamine amidotransferase
MCRLVGVVASEVTEFGLVLREAPRSLAHLSEKHPDGWGVAAHGARDSNPPPPCSGSNYASQQHSAWRIDKGTERASLCTRFEALASRSRGTVLIAHVRQKTVGGTRLENTHPFARDGWVFAHNGTIDDQAYVRERISPKRRDQIRGDTDSEALFAFFLTRLDDAGRTTPTSGSEREDATHVLAAATAELRGRRAGAFNFLLSDGESCFVHRFGRSLFLLERRPSDGSGPKLDTAWRERRHAVLVASEQLTNEPWRELAEGTLLRIDRLPVPCVASVKTDSRLP